MLNNILPLIRKELRSYFNSPNAYVVTVTFVVFCAIWVFYLQTFFAANTASLRSLFGIVPMAFIIVMPAITMRSWAEERKLGTMEVLLTLPFRESTLVLGKFLAAVALLAIMIGLTLPLPLMLSQFGDFALGGGGRAVHRGAAAGLLGHLSRVVRLLAGHQPGELLPDQPVRAAGVHPDLPGNQAGLSHLPSRSNPAHEPPAEQRLSPGT